MGLQRWKPSVDNHWLLLFSGLVWTLAGGMLCFFAYGWLGAHQSIDGSLAGVGGVVLALAVYRFGFSRLAIKNIKRICHMTGKVCLFAFQDRRSYFVATFMSAMGYAMRSSGVIPKPLLAVAYIGIGGGLLLSSVHYYVRLGQATTPDRLR